MEDGKELMALTVECFKGVAAGRPLKNEEFEEVLTALALALRATRTKVKTPPVPAPPPGKVQCDYDVLNHR